MCKQKSLVIMDNLHPMRIRAQQQTYSLWFSVKMHSYTEFKKVEFCLQTENYPDQFVSGEWKGQAGGPCVLCTGK